MFSSRRITTLGGEKLQDQFSVVLDGTDDYVACGSGTTLDVGASAFSVSAWFYPTGNTGDAIVSKGHSLGSGNGWALSISANEAIYFDIHDASARDITKTANSVITLSTWNHVVAVRPSGTTEGRAIYVNGVDITHSNEEDVETITDASLNFEIGNCENNREFASHISDVAFYKGIALSASQVATIYNGREPYNHAEGVASSYLNGWWRMGDGTEGGSGSTVYDMSGNGNNGTLQENAAFSGFVK